MIKLRRRKRPIIPTTKPEKATPKAPPVKETMVTAFGRQIAKQIRRRSLRKVIKLCSAVYYDDANKFIECTIRLGKLKYPEEL